MRKGGAIEHNFLEDVGPHLDVFRDALHILLVSDLCLEALLTKGFEPADMHELVQVENAVLVNVLEHVEMLTATFFVSSGPSTKTRFRGGDASVGWAIGPARPNVIHVPNRSVREVAGKIFGPP